MASTCHWQRDDRTRSPRPAPTRAARAGACLGRPFEIVDLIADAGTTYRGHADKVSALRREAGPGWTVASLPIVRGTVRNRNLVRELRTVRCGRRLP